MYRSPYRGPLQMVNERLCKSRNLDQEKSIPLYALYALCMGHTCVIKAPPPRWPARLLLRPSSVLNGVF